MLEDELLELVEATLSPLGARAVDGEESREPPLDVLRFFVRPVRLSRVPILGRGLSVVALARQPVDLGIARGGYRTLLERLAMAVNGRFPPVRGLSVGLTAVVVTPEPIGPEDDAALAEALAKPGRSRCVPLGVFRVNPGQEALAFALAQTPENLFPEAAALADALTPHLRRFVPPIPGLG
jgi:hypothetical protein